MSPSCTDYYFQTYLWKAHVALVLLEMDIKKKACLLFIVSNKQEK